MNKHSHSDCQEIIKRINAYIDGELDSSQCAQLEAHIDACTDCQIVFNTLKKTIQLCQGDREQISLPPEVRQRLLDSLGLGNENDDKDAQ